MYKRCSEIVFLFFFVLFILCFLSILTCFHSCLDLRSTFFLIGPFFLSGIFFLNYLNMVYFLQEYLSTRKWIKKNICYTKIIKDGNYAAALAVNLSCEN